MNELDASLEQLQAHLLKVSQQIIKHEKDLAEIAKNTQASQDMLASLWQHTTASRRPQFEQELTGRFAELNEKLEQNESQLVELAEKSAGNLRDVENQLNKISQGIDSFTSQVRQLSSSEQIENLD